MEKKFVVYMHTSPSNKRYIGITSTDVRRRWQNGFGYRNNPHFFNAIMKYGWENFTHDILFENIPQESACEIEQQLIKKYKTNNSQFGYNRSFGGENPHNGEVSRETRQKIRNARLGSHHTPETIEKLRIIHTGLKHSEVSKRKMSESKKGSKNGMYGKKGGETQKNAVRKKICKPVICIETQTIYPSIKDAERMTGICDSGIHAVCKRQRATAGGYHWEYYKAVDDNV
jgi:group I intron endonuclease